MRCFAQCNPESTAAGVLFQTQVSLQSGASGLAGPATSSNGADPGGRPRIGLGAAP